MTTAIYLSKDFFEQDARALLMAFYPGEEIRVYKGSREGIEAADRVLSIVYEDDSVRVTLEGVGSMEKSICIAEHRETRTTLKKMIYCLLSQATGKQLPWGTLTGIRPTKIPMSLLEQGCSDEMIFQHMREAYLCSEEKSKLSLEIAKRELKLLKRLNYENGYSLYIGIPFCPTTCLYCSFTSYPIGRWAARVDEYLEALFKEIEATAQMFAGKYLNTIYFGGGTPTTLTAEQLDRLLTKVEKSFDLSHLLEFTVEAGRPDSITREKLEVMRRHPVTRISINPQTMQDKTLKIIGRQHSVQQICDVYAMARELGFDNINMDLILGLPDEGIAEVENTMQQLAKLKPDNITVHSLAIKRTARLNMFKEDYAGLRIENTEEMMGVAAAYTKELGMEPYYLYRQKNMAGNFENTGYAMPGKAGIYNILIMEEKQSIVALGAGATTKVVWHDNREKKIERIENVKDVSTYLSKVDEMIERKRRLFGIGSGIT
ncbi:MAG: coproporphyrinogen dehydrogenase HemZ [Lachnospiraceae bacterium]